MEMGKLTAKLRDAVPVCLMVNNREIKRYKNIEIPDELKKLEYQDFKFDVPLIGAITFKIMFEPGVLPEEFPQSRGRRTRKPMRQDTKPEVAATAVTEAQDDAVKEAAPQEAQPSESIHAETVGALAQEDTQAAAASVDTIAEAVASGEATKAENIGDKATDRVLAITAEPENAEATAQPESVVSVKKTAPKGKGKKCAAPADSADK